MSSFTATEWAAALREGTLCGVTCTNCTATYGTPVSVCHDCGARDLETTELPSEGTIHSVTRIEVAPVGFEAPYHVAVVQVRDARVMGRISADASEEPTIGDSVRFTDHIDHGRHVGPVFELL